MRGDLAQRGFSLGSCLFNPSDEESCVISLSNGQIFREADYQVCVEAPSPTDYRIYEENVGNNCGYVYEYGPYSSVKDYGIFLQTAKYADASFLDSSDFDFDYFKNAANDLLEDKYSKDCSGGCVLPLKIYGLPQNIQISHIALDYVKNGEDHVETEMYNLGAVESLVSFSGLLDLSYTGFIPKKSGYYSLDLAEKQLFKKDIVRNV